jgi:hypothetical protein
MTCQEHLLTEWLRRQPRRQTDYWSAQNDGWGKEIKDLRAAERTFDRLIRHSIFQVMADNFIAAGCGQDSIRRLKPADRAVSSTKPELS